MNDDKKIEMVDDENMVDASEPMAEYDPVVDEMLVTSLQNEITELRQQNEALEYRMGAMGDMARMNAAGGIFAALINHEGKIPMDSSNLMNKSIKAADLLISHYEEIAEKKTAQMMKKIAEQQKAEEIGGDTVQ